VNSFISAPASCLLLSFHEEVINREKDPDQTSFPAKLHKACVRCSAELRSVYFILSSSVEPVRVCLVPLEEADSLLYLSLFLQQEMNHSLNGDILFTAVERNS